MKPRAPTPPRFPVRRRKGRCFELAGRGIDLDPTWRLIHGRVAFSPLVPLLFAHAWLEKNGYVYDTTLDRVLPKRDYVTQYRALTERRYSIAQVRRLLVANEHWGPWHPCEDISIVEAMGWRPRPVNS